MRRGDGEAAGRRFGLNSRGELVVALTVLAATAVLSGLAPARVAVAASAAKPVPQAQASGQDYATTVRVHLTVTPGAAGENAYVAWVDDYDSGDPLATVTAVRLECSLPAEPSVSAVDDPAQTRRRRQLARPRPRARDRRPVAGHRDHRGRQRRA